MFDDVSLTDRLKAMSRDELLDVQALIAGLLDNAAVTVTTATNEMAPQGKPKAKRQHSAPFIEVKVIKGRKYAYRRWYEGGRFRSEYVGPVNSDS